MSGYKVEVAVLNPAGYFGAGQHASMRLTAPDGTQTILAFYPHSQAGGLTSMAFSRFALILRSRSFGTALPPLFSQPLQRPFHQRFKTSLGLR